MSSGERSLGKIFSVKRLEVDFFFFERCGVFHESHKRRGETSTRSHWEVHEKEVIHLGHMRLRIALLIGQRDTVLSLLLSINRVGTADRYLGKMCSSTHSERNSNRSKKT
eukprot:PhF_6_TR24762/c0_g1_i1/m.33967